MSETRSWPPLPPVSTGLRARCPRCGRGPLFRGLLTVRDSCPNCGLDLTPHDSGDGPAVFVILILGAIVVGIAIWLEVAFTPPLWVHAVVLLPVTIVLALVMLRLIKGVLVALHFKNLRFRYDGD